MVGWRALALPLLGDLGLPYPIFLLQFIVHVVFTFHFHRSPLMCCFEGNQIQHPKDNKGISALHVQY